MTTDSPPKRIAIVGGGISAIITAFELTATPELRAQNKVTIYQMGWRLGGKLASAANPEIGGRNEEHGLHVWFGFYDNAFNDIAKCYDELNRIQPLFRYKNCFEAFQPNDYTPIGHRTGSGNADGYGWWPMRWPTRAGVPGQYDESEPHAAPLALLREILRWLRDFIEAEVGLQHFVGKELRWLIDECTGPIAHLLHLSSSSVHKSAPVEGLGGAGIDHAVRWLETLETKETTSSAGELSAYLGRLKDHFLSCLHYLGLSNPDKHPILSAIELVFTNIRGLLNPKYDWLSDFNLNRIDYLDYRAWLLENGGDPDVVNGSSYVRALYDIPFAYEDGSLQRPNFAAGAAMRWSMRSAFTYRGHAMYVPQCGFGEAVIAPYYEVLRARGVDFHFFHKLISTGLSQDESLVQSLTFAVQATTVSGNPYEPVTFTDGLYRWPIDPDWEQLVDGERLKKSHVDFESHWNSEPPAGQVELRNGTDFDHVVIALAGAVWKRLNTVDAPPIAAMLDASPALAAAADSLGIVGTASVQFWMNKTTKALGWTQAPATVGGPEPLDVWADMSPVLAAEAWPPNGPKPLSLHYLCGPLDTTLFAQPSTNTTVPVQADAVVQQLTQQWVAKYGTTNWPGAETSSGSFDYDVLFDSSGAVGPDRLASQYLRANISPTECCGTSFAGTTRHRVSSDDFLFVNASIVGADTNTGINVTCVEGATISARKAARAICGSPAVIPGENYMGGPFPPSPPSGPSPLA